MPKYQWKIKVANPSPYERSDYVEVDLESIGVDSNLNESSLRLFRQNDRKLEEIPFQVDYLLGKDYPKRILIFLAENTPPNKEDYSEASATYLLKKVKPIKSSTLRGKSLLDIDYYHDPITVSKGDSDKDGFNIVWDSKRPVYGIKLRNDSLEIFFSLSSHPKASTSSDYKGSVSSVLLKKAPRGNPLNPDNMLSPYGESAYKYWGKLTKLVFFPPPWEVKFYYERSLQETKYKLIYANKGLMRSIITLQSEPFTISYEGKPFFNPDEVTIKCNLYRIISLHPKKPFYLEELIVLTEKGYPISFRPYYHSVINHPNNFTDLARMENIPDYFAVWKHFNPYLYYGYGFASDSHIRQLELSEYEVGWRLQLNYHHKVVHYFMFNDNCGGDCNQDFYHVIGKFGWYEPIFKPLKVLPVEPFHFVKQLSLAGR